MRSHAGVWRPAATVNTHAKLIIGQRERHALSFQLGLGEMLTLLGAGTKITSVVPDREMSYAMFASMSHRVPFTNSICLCYIYLI